LLLAGLIFILIVLVHIREVRKKMELCTEKIWYTIYPSDPEGWDIVMYYQCGKPKNHEGYHKATVEWIEAEKFHCSRGREL